MCKASMAMETGFEEELEKNVKKLLDQHNKPSAIIAQNDQIASKTVKILENSGFRVPDDISVIGYDNDPEIVEKKDFLTTIQQPRYEMGQSCVDWIESFFNSGEFPDKTQHLLLASSLVIRKSVGKCSERALSA